MVINNNNTPLFMKNNLYAGNIVSSFVNLDDTPVQQNLFLMKVINRLLVTKLCQIVQQ